MHDGIPPRLDLGELWARSADPLPGSFAMPDWLFELHLYTIPIEARAAARLQPRPRITTEIRFEDVVARSWSQDSARGSRKISPH